VNYADVLTTCEFVDLFKEENRIVNANVMESAGYYVVSIDPSSFWDHAHNWCKARYGEDNYIWTGEKFWFNTHKEALLFYAFYKDWLED